MTFGSDWPVAPLEAGQGIWVVATRTGPPTAAPQRLSMRAAIDGYTRWPAYASFEDARKGALAPGMLADLVILSSDLLAHTPDKPADIVVTMTIFDGKVVYEGR